MQIKRYILVALIFFIIGYSIAYFLGRREVRHYQDAVDAVNRRVKLTEGKLQESLATAERIQTDLDTVNRRIKELRTENNELRTVIGRLGKSSSELATGITNAIDTINGSQESIDRSTAILRSIQETGGKKD